MTGSSRKNINKIRERKTNRKKFFLRNGLLWFRMLVYFAFGAIVPLIIFASISIWRTSVTIYEQTNRFATELVGEVSRNIEGEIRSLQTTSIDIAYSAVVQELSQSYAFLTREQRNDALSEARLEIARALTFRREITDVILYIDDNSGIKLYGNFAIPFRIAPEYESFMISEAYSLNGRLLLQAFGPSHLMQGLRLQQDLVNNSAECLIVGRAIRNLPYGHIMGVLAMRLDASYFNSSLHDINVAEDAKLVAFDARGNIMLTTDETMFTTGFSASEELFDLLRNADVETDNKQYQNGTYLVFESVIRDVDWTVALLVPRESLDREIWAMIQTFLLILGLSILICIVVAHVFHKTFSKPIIRLIGAMNAADGGNLNVDLKSDSLDEIGQATRSFTNMIERIRRLLDDVKAEEAAKRAAELSALQAQINPHFLSNTLGAARRMAQNQKAENIDQLLSALIDLLHVSMSSGNDMITVGDEITYVQSYVEIMRFRNYSSFDVQFHIQDDCNDYLVPKLLLQPLVENALIHGISGKGNLGKIDIRLYAENDVLFLTVTDNGKGIAPEDIETILNSPPENTGSRFSGIGLYNVKERIIRSFGEEYGLTLESIPNIYTTAEITLPARK